MKQAPCRGFRCLPADRIGMTSGMPELWCLMATSVTRKRTYSLLLATDKDQMLVQRCRGRMSPVASTVAAMKEKRLFLEADAAIREVFNSLSPEQLDLPVPSVWTGAESSTMRDVVASHTKDEAWVPDVLADHTIEEVGDRWNGDLLGSDPIGNYNRINDVANDAVAADAL